MTIISNHRTILAKENLKAYAPNTQRMYAAAWTSFVQWSDSHLRARILPVTAQELYRYLKHLADCGRKWSTITTHKTAIVKAHKRAGVPNPLDDPAFADLFRELVRTVGKQQQQAMPLTETQAAAINATAFIPRITSFGVMETPAQAKDRGSLDVALVSVMREAMLRTAEAEALTWADLQREPDGTGRILVRRSKTDQAAKGTLLFISRTSVQALHNLAQLRNPQPEDRIFSLEKNNISDHIARAAAAAGLPGRYTGHSPRIGMAIDLAQAGSGLPEIQQAGRWESPDMPAKYIRGITAGQGAVARYSQSRGK